MKKIRFCIRMLFIFIILTIAVNAAILHFGFGVSFSDLAGFAAGALGISSWDSSFFGDISSRSAILPVSPEGDISSEMDNLSDGNGSSAGDGYFSENGSSAESDPERDGSSVTGQAGGDSTTPDGFSGGIPDMSSAVEIFNKLSFSDKIALAEIAAKIGFDGLNELYEIIQDGITSDEILYIRNYIQDHLKPSDIEKLEDIIIRNSHLYAITED